jgi:hypothetical protein
MPTIPRRRARSNATKLGELGIAAPQVIVHRLSRMALAGAAPSSRDRKEFTGMVVEKQLAFMQSWAAMWAEGLRWQQQLALSFLGGPRAVTRQMAGAGRAFDKMAGKGLAPVHRKAVGNAKRLSRTKLR